MANSLKFHKTLYARIVNVSVQHNTIFCYYHMWNKLVILCFSTVIKIFPNFITAWLFVYEIRE